MGRHAGWIAAAGGLASTPDTEIPIVILFPEVSFDKAKFLAQVDANVKKYGYCTVVVSEGVKSADGNNAGLLMELDAILAVTLGGTALMNTTLVSW